MISIKRLIDFANLMDSGGPIVEYDPQDQDMIFAMLADKRSQ